MPPRVALRLSRPSIGPHFTKGCVLLWKVIEREGISQKDIADRIGTSDSQVNLWLYGKRGMSLWGALRFQKEFQIDPAAWLKLVESFVIPGRAA
jgi:plasmid maintenance system antidote protein VapI